MYTQEFVIQEVESERQHQINRVAHIVKSFEQMSGHAKGDSAYEEGYRLGMKHAIEHLRSIFRLPKPDVYDLHGTTKAQEVN